MSMEEIIRLTKELIQFESTHANSVEIRRCAEFIVNYLSDLNVEYRLLVHSNVPSILVLPQFQESYAPILLMSHIDVVDAPKELFHPLEKDRKLYGRGSFDDKYAVALSLVLLKTHVQRLVDQNKTQSDLPFGILITGDEELGGFNGARKVLKQVSTDFCIVLDGGSVEKIVVREKGRVCLKLVLKAKKTSAGETRKDENAIEKLIDDVSKLQTHFVRSNPEHWHRSVSFRHVPLEAVDQQNSKFAEAVVDIRYTEDDNMEALFDWMNRELHSDFVIESIEPLFNEPELSYLDLLLKISNKTRIGFEDGANDARFLSVNGIKGIIWGANGNGSQHALTEHVDVKSVSTLYERLDLFLIKSTELRGNRVVHNI